MLAVSGTWSTEAPEGRHETMRKRWVVRIVLAVLAVLAVGPVALAGIVLPDPTDPWSATGGPAPNATPGTKYALLVGPTEHPNLDQKYWLKGPKNDVLLAADYLIQRAGFLPQDVDALITEPGYSDPTRAAVLAGFARLADEVKPGDFVFVMLSGHGSQQPDPAAPGGMASVFLPSDISMPEKPSELIPNAITNLEIADAVNRIRDRGATVWMVASYAHSASSQLDIAGGARQLGGTDDASGAGLRRGDLVVFRASKTSEVDSEKPFDVVKDGVTTKVSYGIFIHRLFTLLEQGGAGTYRELAQRILAGMAADNYLKPTPQFEGPLDLPLLKTEAEVRSDAYAYAKELFTRFKQSFAKDSFAPLTLTAPPPASDCTGSEHRVLGLVTGLNDAERLRGPQHDVALVSEALRSRGGTSADIETVPAERKQIEAAMQSILAAARCGDKVFIYYSGTTAAGSDLLASMGLDSGWSLSDVSRWLPDDPQLNLMRTLDGPQEYLLLDSELGRKHMLPAAELTAFVTALRNVRADVVVGLDANDADKIAIGTSQQEAGDGVFWQSDTAAGEAPALSPVHGDFAAYYGSAGGSRSSERMFVTPDGNETTYGVFSFAFATALQDSAVLTAGSLGKRLTDAAGEGERYRAEGSNPNLQLFGYNAQLASLGDAIVITAPEPTRGPAAVETPVVTISGHVLWQERLAAVLIDGKPVSLDGKGNFSGQAELVTGLNSLPIIALASSGRMIQRTLDLVFEGDVKALKGDGHRYAVIIANQNYGPQSGFPPLTTPFADADALRDVLTGRYGFTSTATRPDGTSFSLDLRDASRVDIESTLFDLSQAAGEADTVLIYYAGHGIYDQLTTSASWVPADARAGKPYTYEPASAISEAIERIQARKVILISDSCFSGALLRGGPEDREDIDDSQRVASLLKLSQDKSRILISSGNNEPVADTGGAGHSIFAAALLRGLSDNPHDEFSAQELFNGYILGQVTANAKQEPQFRPLDDVGHEGGDVIFIRQPG